MVFSLLNISTHLKIVITVSGVSLLFSNLSLFYINMSWGEISHAVSVIIFWGWQTNYKVWRAAPQMIRGWDHAGKTQLSPFKEHRINASRKFECKAPRTRKAFHSERSEEQERTASDRRVSLWLFPFRLLARSLPAEVTHQKGLPANASRWNQTSEQQVPHQCSATRHAPSSSFTCANTPDAVLPFPAQTSQEIPTMFLHFPRPLGS